MDRLYRSPAGERAFDRYVVGRERIVFTTRKHLATLAEPVLTTVVSFVAVVWVMWTFEPTLGDGVLVLGFAWLAVLGRLVYYLVEWRFAWFGSTDRRLLLQTGLVTHKVAMMPLEKVTDMSYSRSFLGQLLGYGQFVLESAGQEQALRTITFIPHPDETYRLLVATIFGRGARDEDEPPPTQPWVAGPPEPDEPVPPSFPPVRRGSRATGPEQPTQLVRFVDPPFVDPVTVHVDPWRPSSPPPGDSSGPAHGADRGGSGS
jgi:hypothetical protein